MNRFDFFFRQKVTEGELDAAFDAAENALFNFALDVGIVGITDGAAVSQNAGTPNLTVDVGGPGSIYDQLGQRINWTGTQDVDCSVDENSNPTAVVTPGNEKWLSIFAKFQRSLSDARLDGTGASVFFNRAESFVINVVQGAESVPSATKPSLRSDEILLADVKLIYGQTQILNADIDTSRRQDWTNDATTIEFTGPSNNWHDGSNLATNTLDGVINAIVDSLADENTDGNGGADRIGTRAKTVGTMTIAAGSVDDQLFGVLNEIQNLKKERTYIQMTSTRLRKELAGGGYIMGLSFGNNDNETLGAVTPVNLAVGVNAGFTAGIVYSFEDFVQGVTDQSSNLINAPDLLYDAIYVPSSNRHIVVGRIDASSGADIETCDDGIGVSWTSRTPTGMTAATDLAYCVIQDQDSGDIIVGGANGKIIRSADDGASWAAATTIPGGLTSHAWKYIAQNGLGDILIVGNAGADGRILHSNDGGDTWTDVTPAAFNSGTVTPIVWEPVAQRWFTSEQVDTHYSTNTAGTAWALGQKANNGADRWVTDGDSGVIFGLHNSISDGLHVYATEDLGVTMLVDAHFENNPDGATHTSTGWEYAMPSDSPNTLGRSYFAQGRFWLTDEFNVWVSPSRGFTAIDGTTP